jgi:pullulanase
LHLKKNKYKSYLHNDLGVHYFENSTIFKIWAPTMAGVNLNLYHKDTDEIPYAIIALQKDESIFTLKLEGNFINKYYTYKAFEIDENGIKKWYNDIPDIYAHAVGVNGKKGMIVNLQNTNPDGWQNDKNPFVGKMQDAIIYELHVRDYTLNSTSNYKGKFLGLTDLGLFNSKNQPIGLSHLIALGVTHVQLLPCFDFATVDETQSDNQTYNWGYDPLNYNVPEGSYATNASDGNIRIFEFKTLIKTLHDYGIAVIMDMVYNHTYYTEESYFNQIVPDYYYRKTENNTFSNASGCGNETASEHTMMRKFIVDSVLFWTSEYHIDGFRFDLMAVHDIETINILEKAVRKLNPSSILLGEGWTADTSTLSETKRATKHNVSQLDQVAVFCDDLRDGIKGNVFEKNSIGFVAGNKSLTETIKFGLVGAVNHPQIDYTNQIYGNAAYASFPHQIIAYCECHDNYTLWDKLKMALPNETNAQLTQYYKLALSIVMLSQGIPFIHAGQELCRSKNGDGNSYKSSDAINAINWEKLNEFDDVHQTLKQLINIRKAHPSFKLNDAQQITKHISFSNAPNGIIYLKIVNVPNDSWQEIHIVINACNSSFDAISEDTKFQKVFSSTNNWTLQTAAFSVDIFVKNEL